MAPPCKNGHDFDPDTNFCCKLRYWRENGAPSVQYRFGQDKFHNTTIKEQRDKAVAEARENGIDPQPAGVRWV